MEIIYVVRLSDEDTAWLGGVTHDTIHEAREHGIKCIANIEGVISYDILKFKLEGTIRNVD